MLLCFEFQRWVDSMENPPKPLKFAPKIALAVCIGMLDDNYKKVAYHLNDKGELRESVSESISQSVNQSYSSLKIVVKTKFLPSALVIE